ncbi:MAG: DPP IV N-terminal domain-containing protein [Gemmatimonadales bacterium]
MRIVLFLGLLVGLVTPLSAQDYHRAEQLITWNALQRVYHDQAIPQWYRDSTRFWYRVHTRSGFVFRTVDPKAGAAGPLFDNARLAAGLSVAADSAFDPVKLPFATFEFADQGRDESAIRVRVGKRDFRCELAGYRCAAVDTLPPRIRFVRSPDERWDAFVSDRDLWIRPAEDGDSIRLTTDGDSLYGYGVAEPRAGQVRRKLPARPTVIWSPDSRRLAVARYDERKVATVSVVSMTASRPVTYTFPYALPGDSVVGMTEWYVVDVASRAATRIDVAPEPTQSFFAFGAPSLQWSAAGDRVYLTNVDRGPKHVRLLSADPATGATTPLLADSSSSYVIGSIDLLAGALGGGSNWKVLKNGEIVWLAERDGFAHLYRHGPDGAARNQLTRGPWTVVQLLWVDQAAGRVYFSAKGREEGRHPDYAFLYSVGLDGSGLTLLSPEDANHQIRVAPAGRYFVDAYSTVASPPVVVLRGPDGRVIRELERADIADLVATGWRPGETFMAKARDGVTDVWGVIWKPSGFDSTRRYPVVDHIYPGPLISPVMKSFFPSRDAFTYAMAGQVQALAALGFIVVSIDALGNTARSKALYATWYGRMGDHGVPDHIAVLKQLAQRIPQLDLERVGIYGHSGGGFASTGALLQHGDFYKVAVSTAGNHDNRTYYHGWGERFQGLLVRDTVKQTDNYAAAANRTYAGQLDGKLFLMHGDLDDNVHPAHTIGLVDALIKANKSFDLLIVPDADHDLTQHPYVIRRTWDYFVEHLLGAKPPANFAISKPTP